MERFAACPARAVVHFAIAASGRQRLVARVEFAHEDRIWVFKKIEHVLSEGWWR
ncbi:hypothetical protein ACFFYR_00655 [Paraburkholderia dipogonis]|uniref:hypothetical protein n=1 Tax=Paraburkholderia dipogonis TaxID=1211383 RepID=UPI00141A8904|nr:hypothetical protein [Paraburkholderia dipogonis]